MRFGPARIDVLTKIGLGNVTDVTESAEKPKEKMPCRTFVPLIGPLKPLEMVSFSCSNAEATVEGVKS